MIYRFKKGKHWPQWWWLKWLMLWNWPLFYGNTISYKVRFHKDCEQPYMEQWNKLCGFSIGLLPKKHSARFGFDFYEDDLDSRLMITHYKHEFYKHNGAIRRPYNEIEWVDSEEDFILTITKENVDGKTRLWYEFEGELLHSEQTEIPYSKWGWELGAYFGGLKPTTKDCTISVTRIK